MSTIHRVPSNQQLSVVLTTGIGIFFIAHICKLDMPSSIHFDGKEDSLCKKYFSTLMQG